MLARLTFQGSNDFSRGMMWCDYAGTLTLHEADLLEEGSFDAVVKGARYVFHTASPFFIKAEHDAQKELVEPALHGTQVRVCLIPDGLLPTLGNVEALGSLALHRHAEVESSSLSLSFALTSPALQGMLTLSSSPLVSVGLPMIG